jgi:hypothetical protein|tara:strand:- start:46 stop:540 length:495 start_codon:yes stop_codon:yes gene_type:complete
MRLFKTFVVFIISGILCFWFSALLLIQGLELERYDETAWFWLLLLGLTLPAPIAISHYLYKNVFSTSAIANRKEKKQKELDGLDNLSSKYQILRKFQTVLYIFLILDIIGGFVGWANVADMRGIPEWGILIYGILWIFGLFGIFCAIKIIDFIFDLDKVKSDKV